MSTGWNPRIGWRAEIDPDTGEVGNYVYSAMRGTTVIVRKVSALELDSFAAGIDALMDSIEADCEKALYSL